MKHRLIASGIGLLVILTIVSGVVYWQWPGTIPVPVLGPPPVEAVPTISWTPSSVSEVIGQGQTKTIQVSFTPSEDVSGVVVQVVPQLQPFVQTSHSSFANISEGQTLTLDLIMSASADAPLGTATGTVQLNSGERPAKTFGRPLPVMLLVVDPKGIDVGGPPFGALMVHPLTINAGSPRQILAEVESSNLGSIPSNIALHRMDDQGNVIEIVGLMRDDAQGGDRVAGDSRFALLFTLHEPEQDLIRVQASAAVEGLSRRPVSTEQRIQVLEAVNDTGPEDVIRNVANMMLAGEDVSGMQHLFSGRAFVHLEDVLSRGVTTDQLGQMFLTARLNWKTKRDAEFTVMIVGPGDEVFSALVILHKDSESGSWRIETF